MYPISPFFSQFVVAAPDLPLLQHEREAAAAAAAGTVRLAIHLQSNTRRAAFPRRFGIQDVIQPRNDNPNTDKKKKQTKKHLHTGRQKAQSKRTVPVVTSSPSDSDPDAPPPPLPSVRRSRCGRCLPSHGAIERETETSGAWRHAGRNTAVAFRLLPGGPQRQQRRRRRRCCTEGSAVKSETVAGSASGRGFSELRFYFDKSIISALFLPHLTLLSPAPL